MSQSGFSVDSTETVFESPWTTIRRDTVRMPDGSSSVREIADHISAVAAVPIDADGAVVMLRQYRHAFGKHFLELPAGVLDVTDESHADAVLRELAEEVELQADTVEPLIMFTNSAGWTTETTSLFIATDLRSVERPTDFVLEAEEADMTVIRIPLDEAVAMVHRGEIVDAKTVVGLLAVRDHLSG